MPISRLASAVFFKSANFDDFRSVIDAISHQVVEFKTGINKCVSAVGVDALAVARFIQESNTNVEGAFHLFWTATTLHLLPKNIYHYREPHIISCDVRTFLTELLENISCSADAVAAERTNRSDDSSVADNFHIRQLSLADFRTHLVKLHSSTPNLFQAFYAELLMEETSIVFRNLLLRHSELLENWRF